MADKTYFEQLRGVARRVADELRRVGIEDRYLQFGGPGEAAARQPIVPTDARSEFLANRAMGDWAEAILAAGIRESMPDWKAVRYGDSDRIAAGQPGFREFYIARLEEVRLYGNRPDLLLFPRGAQVDDDLSDRRLDEVDELVRRAAAAIEVRSSKFEAETYIRVRKRQVAEGKTVSQETPSYTVKVEDLRILFRWIERYGLSQAYCQVFFDSIYAMNVLDIFGAIAAGKPAYKIETPAKNQQKSTIMIPVTSGAKVGRFLSLPQFHAEHRVTDLGRHDVYVVPRGGEVRLDPAELERVLRI